MEKAFKFRLYLTEIQKKTTICCTYTEISKLQASKREIGIDLGIKDFAITSGGEKIANPKYLKKSLKRLKMLQRRLSRKTNGSQNRNKARIRLATMYEYIKNQRENFLHQLTTRLVRSYDLICMEDLNVREMMSNHCLAQSIGDIGIGKFNDKNPETKDLSVRECECPEWGAIHDRDINASQNILQDRKQESRDFSRGKFKP